MPNEAREELQGLLANHCYNRTDMQYPEITVSAIPPWNSPLS